MAEPTIQFLPGSIAIDEDPVKLTLWNTIKTLVAGQEGYCAYRIPLLGERDPDDIPSFVIVTAQVGIVLVDVVSSPIESVSEDNEFWVTRDDEEIYSRDILIERYSDEVHNRLKRSRLLYERKTRTPLVPVSSWIVFYENTAEEVEQLGFNEHFFSCIVTRDDVDEKLTEVVDPNIWDEGDVETVSTIVSLLEGTFDFRRSTSSRDTKQPESMQDFVDVSLQNVFKQDSAQRQISMQIPPGPQRIRGLAGTGKTVVLCLKAALTALNYPNFRILYLFNTQSLYNMIEKWIGDYYAKEAKSAIDWQRVDVLHAWGGRTTRPGLYYNLCEKYGLDPLTWDDVRRSGSGLTAIYTHLIKSIGESLTDYYDLVLIDEAQDFPPEVFQVVYSITKTPKRIIWAYDDFQSLTEIRARGPEELFGKDANGKPRIESIDLKGEYDGGIKKDFILPNCYRNPRITLMVAHGVALGVYSKGGLVDSIDDTNDWNALGYKVLQPENKLVISAGDDVVVERPDEYSRNTLEQLLRERGKRPNNLVQVQVLKSAESQEEYIADNVVRIVEQEGVPPEEIVVITLDTRKSELFLKRVRGLLDAQQIAAIVPGFVESSSTFKKVDCVTLTTAFRAKGNEANVVFVANCQNVVDDFTFRKRDELFVAVTRSRGWTYITGVGKGMESLSAEIGQIKDTVPRFHFRRPEDEFINRRRSILSGQRTDTQKVAELLNQLKEKHPDLLREQLEIILREQREED